MGPWLLLLFIVGDILGTGIYALTGQVIQTAASDGVFASAMVLSACVSRATHNKRPSLLSQAVG